MLKANPLIFIHIPKTAGTSMRPLLSTQTNERMLGPIQMPWGEILEGVNNASAKFASLNTLIHHKYQYTSNYDEHNFINKSHLLIPTNEMWKYWLNNIEDKSNNEIIELHFDMIDLNPIPNDLYKSDLYKNFNWMTMLRDPVERVISEYFYFRKNINNPKFIIWRARPDMDMDIDNIVKYSKLKETVNTQAKWLSGKGYLNDYEVTEDDYDKLINTMKKLDFKVGILERLNDSIDYWNKSFGFNLKYEDMGQIKINKNKPTISKEEKDIIRKNNKLDIKLYNYYLDKLNSV